MFPDKYVKQSSYGGYCNMVREMGEKEVFYHQFTFEIYTETRLKYVARRKNIKKLQEKL